MYHVQPTGKIRFRYSGAGSTYQAIRAFNVKGNTTFRPAMTSFHPIGDEEGCGRRSSVLAEDAGQQINPGSGSITRMLREGRKCRRHRHARSHDARGEALLGSEGELDLGALPVPSVN